VSEAGGPAAAQQNCCHVEANAHHAHHTVDGRWKAAASVTLHCLTGCAIGEWLGLAIGASLGWAPGATITLAVILAFVCGFALTLAPLMKTGMRLVQATKVVWIGEAVSITVMELAMNLVDYHMGGMQQGVSLGSAQYWIAFGAAAVAGYLAAVPVNYWLLQRNLKNCH
jgi:hypothetical protein